MHCRKIGRMKRNITRGIARALTASLLFGIIGSHAEAWTITAQAEEEDVYDYSELDGGGVLSLGNDHNAAIKADGSLWMWGTNKHGQLGNGTTEYSNNPIKVMENVKTVSLGDGYSAAVKANGSLWMWGSNQDGRLGNGTIEDSSIPVKVMENVKTVSLGAGYSAAIKKDGSLWMWGTNKHGQLGNGTTEYSSNPIKVMENVKIVSLRGYHSAAVKTDGSLWMWGSNEYGQLGNGARNDSNIPIKVMENVKTVSLGRDHSAAVKTDGSLWTWGINECGQLGNGGRIGEISTIPIKVMENVKTASLGWVHSAAVKTDDSLWMWGYNLNGELGNGDAVDSNIPIKVMENVKTVSLGWYYSAAIKTDGSLWIWGGSFGGTVPVQIMPTGSIIVPDGSLPEQPDLPEPSEPSDSDDDPINLPINMGETINPQLKVVDTSGKAIADAVITYRGKTFKTAANGIAQLDNYAKGYPLTIEKANYTTKKIDSFTKDKTGQSIYVLSGGQNSSGGQNPADVADSVVLTMGDNIVDLLTQEAQINTYYKDLEFSIQCTFKEPYDKYMIYSGNKLVAENKDGRFFNLRSGSFTVGQPVYLEMQKAGKTNRIKKPLSIQTVEINPPLKFSFGEDIVLSIPADAPVLGGQSFTLHLGDFPLNCEMTTDGKFQIGINAAELMKKDKNWFSTIKELKPDNVTKILDAVEDTGWKKGKKFISGFDADVKVIGYLEGNILDMDDFKGRIFVELSLEGEWENQGFVGPVPVVVEISVEGRLNADGSITFTREKGFSGGALSAGGEVALGLYGGVGVANLISVGIYGKAGLGLNYIFFPEDTRGLDEVYIRGEAGIKGKAFGNDIVEWKIIDGKYILLPDDKKGWTKSFSIDNNAVYAPLDRSYLEADGSMQAWAAGGFGNADGSVIETPLQSATCFDIVPQVIRMGDTVMLFYLADGGIGRDIADRSVLVYSVWDSEHDNWGEPTPVLDDGTADFAPDFYSDGKKIYAVWQNAKESLAGGLTLNEIAERLVLHTAVFDTEQNQFVDLGSVASENGLCQQNPQIVADSRGDVSVYWYENGQDNVFGLSGTNKIYRAILQNQEGESFVKYVYTDENSTDEGSSLGEDVFQENVSDVDESTTSEEEESSSGGQETGAEEDGENREDNQTPSEEEQEPVEDNGESSEGDADENESDDTELDEIETDEEDVIDSEPEQETELSSGMTVQASAYSITKAESGSWKISFLQEENDCIYSADAGRADGKIGYAYAAGTLDGQYNISQGRIVFLAQDGIAVTLESGRPENVEFTPVYADETLTWYQAGDICYLDGNGETVSLFDAGRLPSSSYTLLTDDDGSLEVIFPVNEDGKSNLYRISYENGAFRATLPITEQEDYIQYADGFISDGRTMLVYNRMEVNENLEEVNNSLCMGTLEHSYSDIAIQSVGSMVREDEETGEDVLEITAMIGNHGTLKAEQLSLSLAKSDGTVLETIPIDIVLESGENDYVTAVFSPENITEEAEYIVTVSGMQESNLDNNSLPIVLGSASLQVNAKLIAVAGTRTMYIGIQNTGVTPCGGTVSVRDMETGTEYSSSTFEPITIGQTVFAEVEIEQAVFSRKDAVVLEAVVTPDVEGVESVSDFVTAYAPKYMVNFVADAEASAVYVGYGKTADFPENPVKEGFYFTGWYNAENAGTLYTEETPITEDVTLYAHFAQEESSIPMERCSVSVIPDQLYTGKAVKPAVTVKWGSQVLNNKKDYSVSYQNNKEQGKATVTITGKGKYTGSITRSFMILYSIGKASVSAIPAVNFTGETYTPDVTVTYQQKTLVKNTDYIVTYTNNRNAGTAGVTITGKGIYAGTKTVTFQIKGIDIAGMVFDKISDVTYSADGSKPIVTVKTKDGGLLRSGADYRLSYENTVNKGTATVTVIGNGNYTGTKKMTYKVLAKPLAEVVLSDIENAVYTGSSVKPNITVTDNGIELEQGRDYTVSYSKNTAVGTATMTLKGKGNYTGTVKVPFTIQPVNLENNSQIRVKVNDAAYTGKAVKPTVQVYAGDKKLPASSYKLSYNNNIEKGTAAVTVTGKGNYSGTISANFRIVDKAKLISSLKIDKIASAVYTGRAVEPKVTVMDGTYQLVKGVDYETTYRNQYDAGKATVTINGIGSYAGSKEVTYKINRRAIANKNVLEKGFTIGQISDEKYTGYARKPDVVIKDEGKLLELGKDYKLSYKKNTKIGTASVTLSGIGNYSGSINTITFKITGWDYDSLQAEIPAQVYTGKALKPKVIFEHDGIPMELKTGTAVKITYSDNKNAGQATATITGKGELKNIQPITVTFTIEQADITDAVISRIPNQTLKGTAVQPVPKVKVGKNTLKAGRDFKVSYMRNGVKGEAEVIITGTGNYTGNCRKTFIVQ